MIQCQPIGTIKSPVTKMSQGDWGKVRSEIHLDNRYAEGLKGLEEFSHIIVVFFLDRASFDPSQHLLRRPRGQQDASKVGLFAQRTKYRPNPIGVSTVELISIEDNVVAVKGLDALTDTPVLDLKPYMPAFDKVEGARVPEWVHGVMEGYF